MSAILLPFIAAGGIYLAIDAFSNKTRKYHRSHSTKSTRSNRKKHSDTEILSTSSKSMDSTSSSNSYTKSAPLKSRRHRRKRDLSKVRDANHLFSLRIGHKKKNSEKESKNLFVFYSFGERNKDWDYKNLPSTWKMKRRVLSVNRTSKYNNVDVFSGEKKNQDKMRQYLENAFSQLKLNDIVKDYRIRGINTPM